MFILKKIFPFIEIRTRFVEENFSVKKLIPEHPYGKSG